MFRRLEDRIRELCNWALESQDPAELNQIARLLRAAHREHIERLRISAVNPPVAERRSLIPPLRSSSNDCAPREHDRVALAGQRLRDG